MNYDERLLQDAYNHDAEEANERTYVVVIYDEGKTDADIEEYDSLELAIKRYKQLQQRNINNEFEIGWFYNHLLCPYIDPDFERGFNPILMNN